MNGVLVGHWRHDAAGEAFCYDESWLTNEFCRPLSLSLPLSSGTDWVTKSAVASFFANLLPDNAAILKRIAARYRADSTEAFDLLAQIGRDCVGAVQLLPPGQPPTGVMKISGDPMTEEAIAEHLSRVTTTKTLGGQLDEDDLRISIAGAQEKTALLQYRGQWLEPRGTTPTTHIIKLPLGMIAGGKIDFRDSVENEWLCLELARACGFSAAHAEVQVFGPHKTLVIERFDRRLLDDEGIPWLARLPQEDFCQVKGVPPDAKYEDHGGPGMRDILDILRGSEDPLVDRAGFLAAQLFFWMLAAPDGHAKNFSVFIEAGGGFRLTPLYDVMSAWPIIGERHDQYRWTKMRLAMALRTGRNAHYRMNEIVPRHWLDLATQNAVAQFDAVAALLARRVPAAIESVSCCLPQGFPTKVCDSIFAGLTKQVERLKQGISPVSAVMPEGAHGEDEPDSFLLGSLRHAALGD